MKRILPILLAIIALCSLAANALLYMRYSTNRPLVTMGEAQISKKEYADMMDALYGKPTLTKMVYARIVHAAAVQNKCIATDKDVESRIEEIHRVNPTIVEAAQREPLRAQMLRDDTKTTLELENLRIKDIKVTDAEAREFYQKHKPQLGLPLQMQTSIAVAEVQGDANAAKEMMDNGIALNIIGKQPRIRVVGINGWSPNWNALTPADKQKLSVTVNSIPVGKTAVVQIMKYFFVVRVDKRSEAGTQPFEKIKDRIVRFARLENAPKEGEALAKLYRDANVTFEVPKYATYFDDVNGYLSNLKGRETSSDEKK